MLYDCVLEGMKCGITDRSAGNSDMVDGLRIWFTYRGSIGIKTRARSRLASRRGRSPEVE